MKNITITNTLLASSILLFSACSSNTPKVKKQPLSAYNIMGIERTQKSPTPMFVIQDKEPQKNYPFVVQNNHNNISQPSNHYIHYDLPQQRNYEENSIEIVSYGSYQSNTPNSCNTNTTQLKNDIEWNAKSFLGTKYVWGATGPSKFDCSGFTQWVYRDAGIKIPRVSRDQAKVGEYIRYSNLRRGDMVFFDTKKRRSGKVTHVGIYLGNGNFIHASSGAKKVVIYNFDQKPYYKDRFLWGRRVIDKSNRLASN